MRAARDWQLTAHILPVVHLDLYVGGSPVDTKDSNRAIQVKTPVYQLARAQRGTFGFRPYFYEPWHWEYVR